MTYTINFFNKTGSISEESTTYNGFYPDIELLYVSNSSIYFENKQRKNFNQGTECRTLFNFTSSYNNPYCLHYEDGYTTICICVEGEVQSITKSNSATSQNNEEYQDNVITIVYLVDSFEKTLRRIVIQQYSTTPELDIFLYDAEEERK